MDLRLGNLRRERSTVVVDVYVGQETAPVGCIDLVGFGVVTLDAGGRPLTEGLLTGLFDRARRFAKRNEAEIAKLLA